MLNPHCQIAKLKILNVIYISKFPNQSQFGSCPNTCKIAQN
jgi:hypothetical protein